MIHIDGSFGEGGGQILRTSLSLAAITRQDVTVENIRAGREKPGLRPQHLTSALAVAEICGADLRGGEVGSSKLVFKPGRIKPGKYEFDVSRVSASAGSVNLILQTVLWPLAFCEKNSRVAIKGGTHVPHAPTFNFISEVFLPTAAGMGLACHYEMVKAGYYPTGGGEVRLQIRPVKELIPIRWTDRPKPVEVELTSAVSNLPASIAERQLNTGMERVHAMGLASENRLREYPSPGKGTVFFAAVSAVGVRAGFQGIGELRKRAEKVADEACDEMEAYLKSGAAVDKHLADQLIIPMALAKGSSRISVAEITRHLLTNIAIVERFLDVRFTVEGDLGQSGSVEC